MRHKTFLLLVLLALVLPGCNAVENARFGLMILCVFGVPLIAIQAVITGLGYWARGTAHAIAVVFDAAFSLVALVGVGIGIDVVLELGPSSRQRVLDGFVMVVGLGLVSVAMTAHLIDAPGAAPAPLDGDLDVEPTLEGPRSKRSVLRWATGLYSAIAIGVLLYFMSG